MRVLLTNDAMVNLAGSELVTYTMAVMLRRLGHDPRVFTLNPGRVSDILAAGGIPVTSDVMEWSKEEFDVAHVHHNTCAARVRAAFPRLPMLFVSHGVLPELERPPPRSVGVASYVAVSEEVRGMLVKDHGVGLASVYVVRNGVDTGRFRPASQPGQSVRRVLVISNHFPVDKWATLRAACERVGAVCRSIGMPTNAGSVWKTEGLINEADLVVSLGRGALEAMACCRPVLVWDMHGGDGIIDHAKYVDSRKCNFSGRALSQEYSEEDLAEMISDCRPRELGAFGRRTVLRHHDIERHVFDYEQIYQWTASRGVREC